MKGILGDEFNNGRIWEHDIESANKLVTDYIRSLGGDEEMAEDILGIIHNGGLSLGYWDADRIMRLVDDYIDR